MTSSTLTCQWATLPDREGWVCELWLGDDQVAEVTAETSELTIEVYPRPNRGAWTLPLDHLLSALQQTKLEYDERSFVAGGVRIGSASADLSLRNSKAQSFEGGAVDCEGQPVTMHSVVTPAGSVRQYFENGAEPILLEPGAKLVVLGAADGNPHLLWLEVDHQGHPWTGAEVVLPSSKVRYLCEVGDDLHLKARH